MWRDTWTALSGPLSRDARMQTDIVRGGRIWTRLSYTTLHPSYLMGCETVDCNCCTESRPFQPCPLASAPARSAVLRILGYFGLDPPKVYTNDFCSRPRRARPDTVLTVPGLREVASPQTGPPRNRYALLESKQPAPGQTSGSEEGSSLRRIDLCITQL